MMEKDINIAAGELPPVEKMRELDLPELKKILESLKSQESQLDQVTTETSDIDKGKCPFGKQASLKRKSINLEWQNKRPKPPKPAIFSQLDEDEERNRKKMKSSTATSQEKEDGHLEPLEVCANSNDDPNDWHMLDEFLSNGKDDQNDEDYFSDSSWDGVDQERVKTFVDEKLKEGKGRIWDPNDPLSPLSHFVKERIVLKDKGERNPFDVLPEGWLEVVHDCGMPVYLHRATRVVTMSKPYCIETLSVRKHKIPVSAIPCLRYLKEIEKEKQATATTDETQNSEETSLNSPVDSNEVIIKVPPPVADSFPPVALKTVKEAKESLSLDPSAVKEYCEKRFEFHKITVNCFKSWASRRLYNSKMRRAQKKTQKIQQEDENLIICPPYSESERSKPGYKDTVINLKGKSFVCILHEYVQHTRRIQPKYEYILVSTVNSIANYGTIVTIDGVKFGEGFGTNKKLAKSEAARAALEILIPNINWKSKENPEILKRGINIVKDVELFDQVAIEDHKVNELSHKAGQPHPFLLLQYCLQRTNRIDETEFSYKARGCDNNVFKMRVGRHEVNVICKNKKDGQRKASQIMLQKLHPQLKCWGDLLRLYGHGTHKTLKDIFKEKDQTSTQLQSKAGPSSTDCRRKY